MSPFRGLAAGMIASFLALAGCTSEDRQSAEGAASDGVSPAPSLAGSFRAHRHCLAHEHRR